MLEVDIPGWKDLRLELLELDVNGTLSRDGLLLPEVQGRIAALQHVLEVRLLSADTFGPGDSCRRLGVQAQRLRRGESEAEQKGRLIRQVGAERIVAIANGAMSAKGARSKMLEVDVPGWQWLRLDQLVLDVNGTLTCDGVLLPGIREQVAAVRSILEVRLLSADTFGRLDSIASELGV